MEYLEGCTLREELAKGPLELDRLVELATQIADALDAAHEAGIIHRDIKSANIFVTRRGLAKVLDFGLAKRAAGDAAGATQGDALTIAGTALGTVTHMSPEQVSGTNVDRRSDVFSFGVVLYEMATGALPFQGSTPYAILNSVMHREHAPPSSVLATIPAALDEIVAKALEKDRTLRYQNAADVRSDLVRLRRDLASGRSGQARVTQPSRPTGPAPGEVASSGLRVVEPWDAVARDGRDFAERGSGMMYWFRVPLGGISYADGFRSFLQPALENPKVTCTRFVLDASVKTIGEVWHTMVIPQVERWAQRKGVALQTEQAADTGRFYDPATDRKLLGWVLTDLSMEFAPCFKIFVDDADVGVPCLPEAQVFLATASRQMRGPDGSTRTIRIPDTILRARAPADEKMLVALARVVRQWDFSFM
jgi:hypothetical protein